MTKSGINQDRIVDNTLLLYVRMGLVVLISLYTTRVVLKELGEVDVGIYNTVAGIVLMFAFLSNTISVACQRFFAVEIAQDNRIELQRIFSLSVLVFIVIACIIVLGSEICGIWMLNEKVKVEGRAEAARWVFQFAILSFAFTVCRTPYQGMIIIKEKMKVFAYVSVLEALMNLAIALLISYTRIDRLVFYGALMLISNIIVSMSYVLFCRHYFPECKYVFYWNKGKFNEIFSFAGWNMIGSLSNACKSQGITVLLNVMCGNAVVAARAMAYKIYSTVQQFADNLFTAMRPQMLKSYSSGDTDGMLGLLYQSSKFSYFLVLLISMPFILETRQLLDIWLVDVPYYTVVFLRLTLINVLIDVFANPLATAMQAYGKIRDYHLVCGGFTLLILPVSYAFLKLGFNPEYVYYVSIVICFLSIGVRLLFVRHSVGLPLRSYFTNVIVPIFFTTVISFAFPVFLELTMNEGWMKLIIVTICSMLSVAITVCFVGMTRNEFRHLLCYMSLKINKIFGNSVNAKK